MNTRTPLMAGNWKMNLDHREAVSFVQKLAWKLDDRKHDYTATEVVVLPPFTDLRSVQTLIDGDDLSLRYGAQDLSPFDGGAYTGEISGVMLAKLGCSYVCVGHSERRQYLADTDEVVASKVAAAYRNGLVPIVCIGEGLGVRQAGGQVEYTLTQLAGSLAGLHRDRAATVVIAYEPIWAIGTGEVATPDDAQEVCAAIRGWLAEHYDADLAAGVRVLYGGSVKAANIGATMAKPDVDGALVGGASLDVDEFSAIARFRDMPVLPA